MKDNTTTKAQKALDWMITQIESGKSITISTNYKATKISPKTFASWDGDFFTIGKDGCLYMAQGRGKVCIGFKNQMLVRIAAS